MIYQTCTIYAVHNILGQSGISGGQVSGIVLSILIVATGCAMAVVTAVVCYRKGVCTKFINNHPSSHSTSTHVVPTTTQVFPDSLNGRYQCVLTEVTDSPHLVAATHASEAPPSYNTAAQYTTIPEAFMNVRLSTDSNHNDQPPAAPPAYAEITKQSEHNEQQQSHSPDSETTV